MSNTPNDPFDLGRSHRNPLTPEVVGGSSGTGLPQPAKKKWPMVLAIILGMAFVSMIVCCGVGIYLFGYLLEPVRADLNRMPEVTEEIGSIESISMNFSETVNEADQNPDFIVFDLEGSRGSAKAAVKVGSDGGVEEAILILPDGTRKDLDPSNQSSAVPNGFGSDDESIDEMTFEDETERELRELESSLDL